MRDHLKARAVFLDNQDRRKRLGRLVAATDDEAALDLKMMAVLAGSRVASSFDVLRALCHGHEADGRFDLGEPPEAIATFEKMDLLDAFWGLMRREFDYASDAPSVAGLLRGIFVSELFHQRMVRVWILSRSTSYGRWAAQQCGVPHAMAGLRWHGEQLRRGGRRGRGGAACRSIAREA